MIYTLARLCRLVCHVSHRLPVKAFCPKTCTPPNYTVSEFCTIQVCKVSNLLLLANTSTSAQMQNFLRTGTWVEAAMTRRMHTVNVVQVFACTQLML